MATKTNLSKTTKCDWFVSTLQATGFGHWQSPGGTDKEQLASGQEGPGHHSYGAVYEALLKELSKKAPVKSVLEIGVQFGGSIALWQKLCPEAHITGLDIFDKVHDQAKNAIDYDRATFVWGDAYDEQNVARLKAANPAGYCLAIDDGPHTLKSQLEFIRLYLPLLAKGGIAVVEDVQSLDDLQRLANAVPKEYKTELVDRRYVNGRWDDLMLVIRTV